MVKEYFKNFMLSKFHMFLFTISSIVMGVELYQYIFLSGERMELAFYLTQICHFLFSPIFYMYS